MKIKHEMYDIAEIIKADEFGDREMMKPAEIVDIEDDYDFYEDETVEMERLINPAKLVPNDSLRYSIINIIAYLCGNMINEEMVLYTKQNNSYSPDRPCSLIMKNEFLFKRVLLTNVKKSYASIIEVQEGNIVPSSSSLDVKGLQIRKSTLPKRTRDQLQSILYEDILNSGDNLDQRCILKDIILLEKQIYKSLTSGSKEYFRPAQVKAMGSYENPLRISGFKGCVVWNELTDLNTEKHDLNIRNAVDIIKVVLNAKTVDKLKDFPDVYERAVKLLNDPSFAGGINGISVPLGVETPEWLYQIIDYNTIINDNLSVMPLESVDIIIGNSNINYSNMVQM
jgi:hypothetical protein